ncbi:ABC transporter substrate-binding protein [Pseudonocardia endophytica]|uniref:ABC-type nitrate/sulfonate/bicarbonate transport system substrate-binding protein n=1 Tax=Pseudonocardia endophytica TaxID=401976 RepID=A0A4R1I1K9_PSEEN|nr:ABC transporter substrate-binding protein [Pseudonocardia endophytica]TCK26329.1 ABC-type nitrate/sulfonate/bicarbonate transport system substrate-binding protein [Pseudonocardia endophytica]
MTRPRSRVYAALFTLLAVALSACAAGGGSGAPARNADGSLDLSDVTLRVGPFQEQTIEAAERSGLFADTPYTIDWSVSVAAGPAMESLNADAIDLVWGLSSTAPEKAQADAATAWTDEDVRFKTVALLEPAFADEYPPAVVAVKKDLPGVNSIADLRGTRVGFNSGGNNHAAFLLALDSAGLSPDDVQGVDVPYKDRPQLLRTGSLDADVNSADGLAAAISDGARVISTSKQFGYPGTTALTARKAVLDDPATAAALEDLVGRITRFHAWWNADLDRSAKLVADFSKIDEKTALTRAKLAGVRVVPVTPQAVAAEQKVIDRLHGVGFTKNQVDIGLVFDDRYNAAIERAARSAK